MSAWSRRLSLRGGQAQPLCAASPYLLWDQRKDQESSLPQVALHNQRQKCLHMQTGAQKMKTPSGGSLLPWLQPRRAFCCFPDPPSLPVPQGLCTCSSPCLAPDNPGSPCGFLPSLRSLLTLHSLTDALLVPLPHPPSKFSSPHPARSSFAFCRTLSGTGTLYSFHCRIPSTENGPWHPGGSH